MPYPDQDSLRKTSDFVNKGLTFEVTAIRRMEGMPVGRYGLTEAQFEALATALDAGYFEVPRETDLGDRLNISHQALSERLRRSLRTRWFPVQRGRYATIPDTDSVFTTRSNGS